MITNDLQEYGFALMTKREPLFPNEEQKIKFSHFTVFDMYAYKNWELYIQPFDRLQTMNKLFRIINIDLKEKIEKISLLKGVILTAFYFVEILFDSFVNFSTFFLLFIKHYLYSVLVGEKVSAVARKRPHLKLLDNQWFFRKAIDSGNFNEAIISCWKSCFLIKTWDLNWKYLYMSVLLLVVVVVVVVFIFASIKTSVFYIKPARLSRIARK